MNAAPLLQVEMNLGRNIVLSLEENYLVATTKEFSTFRVLSVYRALRTKNKHSWMWPVVNELAANCHTWVSTDVYKDDTMMGGSALHEQYHVYAECPGAHVQHECARGNASATIGLPVQRVR